MPLFLFLSSLSRPTLAVLAVWCCELVLFVAYGCCCRFLTPAKAFRSQRSKGQTKTGLWRRLPEFEPPVDQSPPQTQVSSSIKLKRLSVTAGRGCNAACMCYRMSSCICMPVCGRTAFVVVLRERARTPSQTFWDPVTGRAARYR